MIAGIRILAETSGVFAETAGGVTCAAALALSRSGRLTPDDEVVLCITAHGLKTPDAVSPDLLDLPIASSRLSDVARVIESA